MIPSQKYPPATRGKIIVWGFLASYPFGGMVWQVLHHLVGFRRLGFDVWYVEDSNNPIYDPNNWEPAISSIPNIRYLKQKWKRLVLGTVGYFDLLNGIILLSHVKFASGLWIFPGLRRLYKEADAVFNLCGSHRVRPDHEGIRCLVLLQTDPVVPQIQVAEGEQAVIQDFDQYDFLFSYGENLGSPDCLVPVMRYTWHPTRPPVCTDWWGRNGSPSPHKKLTTISNWQNLGRDIVWKGETYFWRKDLEFKKFVDLPPEIFAWD